MRIIAFAVMSLLSLGAFADDVAEYADFAIIVTPGLYDPKHTTWTDIDGKICFYCPDKLSAGRHIFGSGNRKFVCDLIGGHTYSFEINGCTDKGRRMDFKGAKEYWDAFDTAAAATLLKEKEVIESERYQADKLRLQNADMKYQVEEIIASIEKKMRYGINKTDPDNLLPLAKEKLESFLQAQRIKQEIEAPLKAKEAARLAKEESVRAKAEADAEAVRMKQEAAREAKERQQLTSFRKSLSDGGETNCGPVVEVKGKLVKVAYAVANYGNEHWIRREEIYPSGYGCSFFNGHYQPPQ